MFDDDTLREKSFINEGNLTSSAYVNVDNKKYKGVTIYARNNFIVNKKTFKIVLKEESKKSITVRIIYTLVSSLFSMLMCCICVAACCRCMGKTPSSRQTNYEVDIIDPNWDADQIRVYQMRRLQRRLSHRQARRLNLQAQDIANNESSSSEEIADEELERQLAEVQKKQTQEFMNSLEEMTYNNEINEFGTPDCIICMETFIDGVQISRIPTCRHFFHPSCCTKWFESKNQEDEQRCP